MFDDRKIASNPEPEEPDKSDKCKVDAMVLHSSSPVNAISDIALTSLAAKQAMPRRLITTKLTGAPLFGASVWNAWLGR